MSSLSCASFRFAHYLHAVVLLVSFICVPAWAADPVPPDEAAPFDIQTFIVDGRDVRIHSFRDPNAGLPWLNYRLREMHKAGSLVSCDTLAGVYLTRYEQAFGGICRLKEGEQATDVNVCADTAVGRLILIPLDNSARSAQATAEFVAANCAGG